MSIEEMLTPVKNISSSQRYVYPWQQPSRSTLTEAERLGIPKGDRGNLNTLNPSGENLHKFYSL